MKVTADGVPVQDVIAAVKLAIKEANVSATDEDRDLRVGSVKLVLHALATRTVGGSLSFTVPFIGMPVRFGAKVTKSDTHEIEINLVPPAQETGAEIREASLDLALVDSIETIRAVVAPPLRRRPVDLERRENHPVVRRDSRRGDLDRHRRQPERRDNPLPRPRSSPRLATKNCPSPAHADPASLRRPVLRAAPPRLNANGSSVVVQTPSSTAASGMGSGSCVPRCR